MTANVLQKHVFKGTKLFKQKNTLFYHNIINVKHYFKLLNKTKK